MNLKKEFCIKCGGDMDGSRFDSLARSLAGGMSRRQVLRGLAAGLGIAVGVGAGGADAAPGSGGKKWPCPDGLTKCRGKCVDYSTDPSHCGACKISCAPGETCCDGQCLPACPAGQARDELCACAEVACSDEQPCPDLGYLCWTDVCVDGTCTQIAADCDDGNPCTENSICSDTLGCQNIPLFPGTPCPDGFCNGQGTCLPPCGSDSECPPSSDPCLMAFCEDQVCLYRANTCDDGNPCTEDGYCTAETGCQHYPRPSNYPCPGGFCDGQGTCRPPCSTADECPPPPPGEECLVSVCIDGQCNLRGKDCDTGNPCTYDSCEEGVGCVSNPGPFIGTPCDGGFCNENGVCAPAA